MERSLRSLGSRYHWGRSLPPLASAEWGEPTGTSLRVHYSSVAGDFPVQFTFVDGRWVLRTMTTSGLKDWRPE